MSPTMDQLARFLQAVGYRTVVGYPYLIVYLHLLVAVIFPIYAGAHASLSRPSSAAKPSKRTKERDHHDDELEEHEQMMEGFGPIDALLLPLSAGIVLASLYFLIKWLEDPSLLNQILNWYFAVFGTLSLARMLKDSMGVFISFVLPKTCDMDGNIWEDDAKHRKSKSKIANAMWTLQERLSRQLDVRVYIHKIMQTHFKIGLQGITSLLLAVDAMLYFNLIDKPWWLTNLLGFGFAYSALQIMSPTTSWTGTLILGALFIYDIYFVFYTPLMVTVATQLDIPAKLLFPRPNRPSEDRTKQAFSMLGLGDIILPGMMIGFALRFDLYLFYLRKQIRRNTPTSKSTKEAAHHLASNKTGDSKVLKATWYPATGGWGERFWMPKNDIIRSERFQGVIFPKTYFRASLVGYILAMLCTLGVMEVYGQAQPALLYLVPGVLGSLWGTALIKGDIKALWAFDESENDQGYVSPSGSKSKDQGKARNKGSRMDFVWKSSILSSGTSTEGPEKPKETTEGKDSNAVESSDRESLDQPENGTVGNGHARRAMRRKKGGESPNKTEDSRSNYDESTRSESSDYGSHGSKNSNDKRRKQRKADGVFDRDRKNELIFISVNLLKSAPATSKKTASVSEQANSSAHVANRTRAKTKVEGKNDDGFED